jgi:hypothetical protein
MNIHYAALSGLKNNEMPTQGVALGWIKVAPLGRSEQGKDCPY